MHLSRRFAILLFGHTRVTTRRTRPCRALLGSPCTARIPAILGRAWQGRRSAHLRYNHHGQSSDLERPFILDPPYALAPPTRAGPMARPSTWRIFLQAFGISVRHISQQRTPEHLTSSSSSTTPPPTVPLWSPCPSPHRLPGRIMDRSDAIC